MHAMNCFHFQLFIEELYNMQLSYRNNDFYVCDVMSGIPYLPKLDLNDNDVEDESIKNLSDIVNIKASLLNQIINKRYEMEWNNQRWFQSQPNNLTERSKSIRLIFFI